MWSIGKKVLLCFMFSLFLKYLWLWVKNQLWIISAFLNRLMSMEWEWKQGLAASHCPPPSAIRDRGQLKKTTTTKQQPPSLIKLIWNIKKIYGFTYSPDSVGTGRLSVHKARQNFFFHHFCCWPSTPGTGGGRAHLHPSLLTLSGFYKTILTLVP